MISRLDPPAIPPFLTGGDVDENAFLLVCLARHHLLAVAHSNTDALRCGNHSLSHHPPFGPTRRQTKLTFRRRDKRPRGVATAGPHGAYCRRLPFSRASTVMRPAPR